MHVSDGIVLSLDATIESEIRSQTLAGTISKIANDSTISRLAGRKGNGTSRRIAPDHWRSAEDWQLRNL